MIDYSIPIIGEFIDTESPGGKATIRFVSFRSAFEQYPCLHIDRLSEPRVFEHYREQYLAMWESGVPFS